MSGALIPNAIASQGHPPRIKRQKLLLSSCAIATALAVTGYSAPVRAQAFQGTPTTIAGTVGYDRSDSPGFETITVDSPTAIVNWAPSDTGIGGGAIDYLPAGMTARYTSSSGSDFTILNRILPTDATRPVAFNGNVVSNFFSPVSGATTSIGNVWFYSPGGIIAGATAVFDVGSLVLTGADIDTTGGLFGPSNTVRFRGATDSRSAVVIQPGAQISALRSGAYVALVSPRISQGGTVNVNGSVAYVAAESVDVSINAGLFNITVNTGSNVNGGGEATLTHTGNTTGPASIGDPHVIYMVNMPKNDGVTMLLSGGMGYAAASMAGVENGIVVLSAGANITSADDGMGNVSIGVVPGPSNNQNASLQIENGAVTSRVLGLALTNAIADNGTGGSLSFTSDLNLSAGRIASLRSDTAGTVTVGGNVRLTTFNRSNVGAAIPGEASIRAVNGGMTIGGTVTLVADETAASPFATAGTAAIEVNGANVSIGGVTQLLASGTGVNGGTTGGSGQGGNATLSVNNGTLDINGNLLLVAQGLGGTGTTTGGDGEGGTASISIGNGALNANGFTFMIARGLGGNGPTGGNGQGGTASFIADDGSLQLGVSGEPDFLQMLAGGFGGTADDGGVAGNGAGGSVIFNSLDSVPDATPSTIVVSQLTLFAGGTGGAFAASAQLGGTGGTGTGGGASLSLSAGNLTADGIIISSAGVGSNGNNAVDAANGGAGGAATGGSAILSVSGGALASDSISLITNATAGAGGNVFETGYGTPTGMGGVGASAIAGNATATFSGGTVTGTSFSVEATGFGGAGGSATAAAGGAGNGMGATAQALVNGGQISFDTFDVVADGDGGDGGNASSQTVGTAGGNGIAGVARFSISSGTATIASLLSVGGGTGGEAGQGGFGSTSGQSAGAGASNGGTSELLVSGGTLTAGSAEVSATADGGEDPTQLAGGDVRGGSALLDISGGSASFTAGALVTASVGSTDEPEAVASPVLAGSAALMVRNGVTVTFGGNIDVLADAANSAGFNGAVAGALGGNASVTIDGTLDIGTTHVVNVSARAFGAGSPVTGGSATGGTASLQLTNGSLIAQTASILAEATGGDGFDAFSSGIAAGSGGTAAGGAASLTIGAAGSFLPTNLTISAVGTGGAAGNGTDGPNGGNGGIGQGGTARLNLDGGTLGDANLGNVNLLAYGLAADGGDALETGYGTPSGNGGIGGDTFAGTAALTITGGSLTASTLIVDAGNIAGEGGSSVSGNGGNGGRSSGGTALITVNETVAPATLSLANASLFATGDTGRGGTSSGGTAGTGGVGNGGQARLTIDGGTVNITSSLTVDASVGSAANSSTGGQAQIIIAGGTTTLGFTGVSSNVFAAFGASTEGATFRGGTSSALLTDGTVNFTSTLFLDASALFSNDGVLQAGGNADGGVAELTIRNDATPTFGGTLSLNADAVSGFNNTTGVAGDASGGSLIVTVANGASFDFTPVTYNFSATALGANGTTSGGNAAGGQLILSAQDGVLAFPTLTADISAQAGDGLAGSASGAAGGSGGSANGGTLSLLVGGTAGGLTVASINVGFQTRGGAGGNGSAGTTGGVGGAGGSTRGGIFDVELFGGQLTVNDVNGNGPNLALDADAGRGGNGGDGSDVGNTGGVGGNGGNATGGSVTVDVVGGALDFGFTTITAIGSAGNGGTGGIGAGTPGNPSAIPPVPPGPTTPALDGIGGTGMGGLFSVEVRDSTDTGSASLAATEIDIRGFNGLGSPDPNLLGRVEFYDTGTATGGGISLASLDITGDGVAFTSDQAVDFFTASRRISIANDANIATGGFVYFRAEGTGGTDIGGALNVDAGGSIIIDHANQPAPPSPTVATASMNLSAGLLFQASPDTLLTANQRIGIQAVSDVTVGTAQAASITVRSGTGSIGIGSLTSTGASTTPVFDPILNGNVADGIRVIAINGITAGSLTSALDLGLASLTGEIDVAQIDATRAFTIFAGAQANSQVVDEVRLGAVDVGGLFYIGDFAAAGMITPTSVPIFQSSADISFSGPVSAGSVFLGSIGAISGGDVTATAGPVSLLAGSVDLGNVTAANNIMIQATDAVDLTSATAGTSGNFSIIEIVTEGAVDIGTLTSDAGDIDIEGDAGITVGTASAGHGLTLDSLNGTVTATSLTTSDLAFGGLNDFDGIGIKAGVGIDIESATSGLDVGMASLGSIAVGSVSAGRDIVFLPGDSLILGSVTAANRFYVANASMLDIVDPDPDGDTPVDLTVLDGLAFAPAGGSVTIGGPLNADIVRMSLLGSLTTGAIETDNIIDLSVGGSVTTGDLISHAPAGSTRFSAITLLAGGSATLGAVTADFADIDIEVEGGLSTGALTAGDSVRVLANGPVTTAGLTGGTFDGTNMVEGYLGSVGLATFGSMTVGAANARGDIGLAAGGSLTTGALTAGRDIGLLVSGNINVASVNNPGLFFISNASLLNALGIIEPALEDGPTILAAAPIRTNGTLTIAGPVNSGSINAPIGGNVTTGALTATDGIRLRSTGNIQAGDVQAGTGASLVASGSITIGNVIANTPINTGDDPFVQGVSLSAGSALTVGNLVSTDSIILSNSNGALGVGDVESIGGIVRLSAKTNLNAGDVRAAGSIFLNAAGTITAGDLTAGTGPLLPGAMGGGIGGGDLDAAPGGIAPGFDSLAFPRCLDCARSAVLPDGFIVTYFGTSYGTTNISDHGYITFGGLQNTFTPSGLGENYSGLPIIAAFFADVDIRNPAAGTITYGGGTFAGRQAFGVTWTNVGYYNFKADKLNTFQLILTNRADTGAGNFDIYFNYTDINWETGDLSGGVGGLGGTSAAVGFNAGTGNEPGTFFEMVGSLVPGSFLNGGPNELRSITNTGNLGQLLFPVRNGVISAGPPEAPTIHVNSSSATGNNTTITLGDLTAEAVDIQGAGAVTVGEIRTADFGSGMESVNGPTGFAKGDIFIETAGALNAPSLEAIGAVTVSADGGVTIASATAGTTASFASSGASVNVADVAASTGVSAQGVNITLGASNSITLLNVAATNTATVTVDGLLGVDGTVSGQTINLASQDIAISSASTVGNASTQTINLENTSQGPSIIGGGGNDGEGEWTLSNTEFGTLQAHDISIFNTFDTLGSPDVILRDLTIRGSGFTPSPSTPGQKNLLGSTLSIRAEAGSMLVEGNVQLVSAGAEDVLELRAEDRIQVVTPTGSISVTGADNALAGTLRMDATRVFVGSQSAFDAVSTSDSTTPPTIDQISERLSTNDGDPKPEGYLQAGRMEFSISDALFIQNSGSSSEVGSPDRAGFTIGSGGIAISSSGEDARIVINGRQATGDTLNPFIAGKDFVPVVRTALATDEGAGFDSGSTINGCITSSVSCGISVSEQTFTEATNMPGSVIENVVEKAEEEADDGTQVIQQLNLPLIRFVDFSGLGFTPVIDEPVTGTGNDDLWMGGPSGGQ